MLETEGVTIDEAARLMGVTAHAVRQSIRRGTIQNYKDGKRRLVIVPPDKVVVSSLPAVSQDVLRQPEVMIQYQALIQPYLEHIDSLNQRIGELQAELREYKKDLTAAKRLILRLGGVEHDG